MIGVCAAFRHVVDGVTHIHQALNGANNNAQEAIDTALETVNVYATPPRWSQVSKLMQQYGVEAFNGSKSPADVLDQVAQQSAN